MSLLSSVAINPFEVTILIDIIERAEKAELDARNLRVELQAAWRENERLRAVIAEMQESAEHK